MCDLFSTRERDPVSLGREGHDPGRLAGDILESSVNPGSSSRRPYFSTSRTPVVGRGVGVPLAVRVSLSSVRNPNSKESLTGDPTFTE